LQRCSAHYANTTRNQVASEIGSVCAVVRRVCVCSTRTSFEKAWRWPIGNIESGVEADRPVSFIAWYPLLKKIDVAASDYFIFRRAGYWHGKPIHEANIDIGFAFIAAFDLATIWTKDRSNPYVSCPS
jgi:hypothetical protein